MAVSFNNAWLGYDLPFDTIESHEEIARFRAKGFEKRIPLAEHHMTIAWFADVDSDRLAREIAKLENENGSLYRTEVIFDRYGTITHDKGEYLFLSPDKATAPEAFRLKDALKKTDLYDESANCDDLHLSIGGPDPLCPAKEPAHALEEPIALEGTLVFTGHDGKRFRRFAWHSKDRRFKEVALPPKLEANKPSRPPAKSAPRPVHTIALFPKIQADTVAAVYLLKAFGGQKYPGIENAELAFWTALPEGKSAADLEADGYVLVDLGGRYDHHLANESSGKRSECASSLIAKDLGIESHPALKKLLAWTKRDDLEGKGTISSDNLDRAFGLSGIIMNLNREYHEEPERVLDIVLPIIDAHVREEIRRHIELPKEWTALVASGKGEDFVIYQGSAELRVAAVQSDNIALPGFLRAAKGFDLIVQRRASDHTNIITKQMRSVDLQPTIESLRLAEARKKGVKLAASPKELKAPGRLDAIPEWYYDDAANTIQNGGVAVEGVTPTSLTLAEVVAIAKDTLPHGKIGSLKRKKEQGK